MDMKLLRITEEKQGWLGLLIIIFLANGADKTFKRLWKIHGTGDFSTTDP